jgi:hypothetical protein
VVTGSIFLVAGSVFVFVAIRKATQPAKEALVLLTLAISVLTSISIAGRPALTHFAAGFASSSPDRYYLGLNALSILIVVISLWVLAKKKEKMLSIFFLIGLVSTYTLVSVEVKPRMPIAIENVFIEEQLCSASNYGEFIEIDIYPENWKIRLPSNVFRECHSN